MTQKISIASMSIKPVYIKLVMILVGLAVMSNAFAADPEIFEKKGKYGLVDPASGKVLVKAKYDTIYPFKGRDYARIIRKGKHGIVSKTGEFYLPCEYNKILFPVFSDHDGKKYFWVSKDGKMFYHSSYSTYYSTPWYKVFYGPDKISSAMNSSGLWMKVMDLSTVAYAYDIKGDGPKLVRLPDKYVLFNDKLYSPGPDRKVVKEGVTAADTVNIGDRRFLKVSLKGNDILLIDRSSGTRWEKKGPGLNGMYETNTWGVNYNLLVDGDSFYRVEPLEYGNHTFSVITNPEYGLKSVVSGSRKLIPFKLSSIYVDKIGDYKSGPLWRVTLNSQQPLFGPDLEILVDELRQANDNFVIVTKSSMGRSLYGNTGSEIVHNSLETVYLKNGFLIAKTDEEERVVGMGGTDDLSAYDSVFRSDQGNLTGNDIIVKKDGKLGLYVEGRGEIVPPQYEGFRRQWGHIFAFIGDQVGLYDDDGNLIIPPKYRSIDIANAYSSPNFYLVKTRSGGTMLLGDKGQTILPAGQIDSADFLVGDAGKWCKVYKNGRMGIMNLQTKRIVIPCAYEDNIFFGNGRWPDMKIGIYRSTSTGELIEIWTIGGKKISSKAFPRSAKYSMKYYLENQLNASFYYD